MHQGKENVLIRITTHSDPKKRKSIIPNAPIWILRVLAKDHDSSVRSAVAKSSHTPPDLLEELAKDSSVSVRQSVACNPNTPVSTIAILAKDSQSQVRRSIPKNPDLSTRIFISLSDLKLSGTSIILKCTMCEHQGRIEPATLLKSCEESLLLKDIMGKFYCSKCKSKKFTITFE